MEALHELLGIGFVEIVNPRMKRRQIEIDIRKHRRVNLVVHSIVHIARESNVVMPAEGIEREEEHRREARADQKFAERSRSLLPNPARDSLDSSSS